MRISRLFVWCRKISNVARFIGDFAKRQLRAAFVTTLTQELDANDARIKDGYPLNEFLTASGAQWRRDGKGNWFLVKPHHLESCLPVRELFEHFNLPQRVFVADGKHQVCIVGRVAALHELGLAVDVNYLRDSYKGERPDRCEGCGQPCMENAKHGEREYASKKGNDTDCFATISQPLVNQLWECHAVRSVNETLKNRGRQ